MPLPKLTIGIEEEYQIINSQTRDLAPDISAILKAGGSILKDQLKPELLQSQVEVGTKVCANIHEAREQLSFLRHTVNSIASKKGLKVAAASTHPFSKWSDQEVTRNRRYHLYMEEMADIARRLCIFGMHVHIGMEDRDLMIDVMNQARYFLPHLLALSTSSPFWHGRNTGLMSYRSILFANLPRTGPPPEFHSWAEVKRTWNVLIKTKAISDPTKIWWDIRPHPKYPTLEFRVFDICTRLDEAICLAAIAQAIVAKLIRLRQQNQSWRRYRSHLINENKWRAVRYGTDGKMIDFGKGKEVEARELIMELLEIIDEVLDELDIRKDVEYVHTILEKGTSAHRQLAVFKETGSLKSVVDHIAEETMEGCQ